MGVNKRVESKFNMILKALAVESWEGVKMLEFGNQIYRNEKNPIPAKEYFKGLGVNHVSVDINGKDGALKYDLTKPIKNIGEPFDVVTNFGTTEHIRDDQYQPFKTMHDMTRIGGVMISVVPYLDYDRSHGKYHYGLSFFQALGDRNKYDIYMLCVDEKEAARNLVVCIYKIVKDYPFISRKEFNNIEGLQKL